MRVLENLVSPQIILAFVTAVKIVTGMWAVTRDVPVVLQLVCFLNALMLVGGLVMTCHVL